MSFASTILAEPSLLAYYRLGEPSGVTAVDAKSGNDGTYVNTPTLGVAGSVTGDSDTAVAFNGTDESVTIPVAVSLPLNSPVTIMLAAYMATADVAASVNPTAFTIGDLDNPNRCLGHVPYTDSKVYWDYGDSTGNGRISQGTFPLDQWNLVHLVSSGTANTFKAIYWNGVLRNSAATSAGPTGGAVSGGFIAKKTGLTFYKGSIDEFAVFTTVLSQATITAQYQAWSTAPTTATTLPTWPRVRFNG